MLSTFDDSLDDRAAIELTCERLYQSHQERLIQQARLRGCDEHETWDVVQDVFVRLFRLGILSSIADRPEEIQTGLLNRTLRWVLHKRWRRRVALKRGLDQVPDSLEEMVENGLEIPCPGTPATDYDRAWAHAVLERSFDQLRSDMSTEEWRTLEPALHADKTDITAQCASGAFRVNLHRKRHRLRRLITREAGIGDDYHAVKSELLSALTLPN